MKFWFAVVLTSLLLPATGLRAQPKKYAVVVGNNLGHETKRQLRFAQSDATKVYRVLMDVGDFDSKESKLLLGKSAKAVLKELERVERLIERDKKRGLKTLLLFYFSGHAEGKVLQLGESSLAYAKLKKHLTGSRADIRLGFLDSCRSGQLIRDKGGRRGPSFDVKVLDEISSAGFAIVTSSADDEVSQETEEFRGGYFTHFLVSALRGSGDETGDGKVTLDEAYRYAYRRTAAHTSTSLGGGQHPMYQFNLQGEGDVILTKPAQAVSKLRISVQKPGRLVLLDKKSQFMIAEAEVTAKDKAEFAVNPGDYNVYYIGDKGQVLSAQTRARAGKTSELTSPDFHEAKLTRAMDRGGLFLRNEKSWEHRLGLAGGWRLWPLEQAVSSYGASFHYRAVAPFGLEPVLRLGWTTRGDTQDSKNYNDFFAQVGIGYLFAIPHMFVRLEALGGMELLRQSGENNYTTGYSYLGLVGLELPLSRVFYVGLDGGVGGRLFQVAGKGIVHRLDAQVMLGLGAKFGS